MGGQSESNNISTEKSLLLFGLVSNGKSTLVNAFLGRELMPTSNLSCTSITVKVSDQLDGNLYGKALYLKGTSCTEYRGQDAVLALQRCNNDPESSGEFIVHEPLGTLSKREFQLTLVDTPGINDALSAKRSDTTKKNLLSGKATALLYVSHIRTCGTTDEEQCLRGASEMIRRDGENGWFFVLNGWDLKDDDEEEFSYIEKIRVLVSKCGLPQPQIFFVSARGALLCRRVLSGEALNRADKKEFDHILRYYRMDGRMGRCKDGKSTEAKEVARDVLACTGVPKLEEAIYQKMKIYTDVMVKGEIAELHKEFDTKSKEIHECSGRLSEQGQAIAGLSGEIGRQKRELGKVQSLVESNRENEEKRSRDLKKRIEALQKELDISGKSICSNAEKIIAQKEGFSRLSDNFYAQGKEISRLSDDSDRYSRALADLLALVERNGEDEKKHSQAVQGQIFEIHAALREKEAAINENSDRITAQREAVSRLAGKAGQCESQIQEQIKEHRKNESAIRTLSDALSRLVDAQAAAAAKVKAQGDEIRELKSTIAEDQKRIVQLEAGMKSLGLELSQFRQDTAEKMAITRRNEKALAVLAILGIGCSIALRFL